MRWPLGASSSTLPGSRRGRCSASSSAYHLSLPEGARTRRNRSRRGCGRHRVQWPPAAGRAALRNPPCRVPLSGSAVYHAAHAPPFHSTQRDSHPLRCEPITLFTSARGCAHAVRPRSPGASVEVMVASPVRGVPRGLAAVGDVLLGFPEPVVEVPFGGRLYLGGQLADCGWWGAPNSLSVYQPRRGAGGNGPVPLPSQLAPPPSSVGVAQIPGQRG